MAAWKAGFQTANSDVTVNYDAVGSGGGREQFLAGAVNFAGSDAYLTDEELATRQEDLRRRPGRGARLREHDRRHLQPRRRRHAQPVTRHAGATSSPARSPSGTTRRSPPTTPAPPCRTRTSRPVHRSDDSGTTQNFTDYLAQAAPDNWTVPGLADLAGAGRRSRRRHLRRRRGRHGRCGHHRVRRREPGRRPGQGPDQGGLRVRGAVGRGGLQGARRVRRSYRVARRPTSRSQVNRTTTTAGVYPIILLSYQMTCQKQAKPGAANLIKAFETYVVSAEGQQAAACGGRLGTAVGLPRPEGAGRDRHHHGQMT